jgi:hypothetical protein
MFTTKSLSDLMDLSNQASATWLFAVHRYGSGHVFERAARSHVRDLDRAFNDRLASLRSPV